MRAPNEYEKDIFKTVLGIDVTAIPTAGSCENCGNGYKGRIAIHEVLKINEEIRDAISAGIKKEDLRELVYKGDVTTLLQDGLQKVLNGFTTLEEVLKLIEFDEETVEQQKERIKESNLKIAIADSLRKELPEKEDKIMADDQPEILEI